MPAQWTGEAVRKMHLKRISRKQLAEHLGVTPEYVSMVLNGHREPENAEDVFLRAIDELYIRDPLGREGA